MTDHKPPPGSALVKTVVGRELGGVVFDATEVALDSIMTEGVLKDLPIVGSIVKFATAGQTIAAELFLRKLLRFLTELKSVPPEDRSRLLDKYPDGTKDQQDLGENLLLTLERLDNVDKPALLARFFAAYIQEKIDYVTFSRLAKALERFNLALTPNLLYFYTNQPPAADLSEEIKHELSLAGLVTAGLEASDGLNGAASYNYSPIGRLFVELGFRARARK